MSAENFQHFIVSNRRTGPGKKKDQLYYTDDYEIEPGLPLHYTKYDFPLSGLNEDSELNVPVTMVDDDFIDQVIAEAEKLPKPDPKKGTFQENPLNGNYRNVTIYIHGFHHIKKRSYKLEIMSGMVNKYCYPLKRVVGKFIFLSWPATGDRDLLGYRAHEQGIQFYKNNKAMFEKLYAELNKRGIQLNLMAHSFGHRILNGFLSMADGDVKLFDKVFLFAADIPHQALDVKTHGIWLKNKKFKRVNGQWGGKEEERLYNLTKLEKIAGKVHCFYCPFDRMLMASADGSLKRREEDDKDLVNNFLCLGNMGAKRITPFANLNFVDVIKEVTDEEDFEGLLGKRKHVCEQMTAILEDNGLNRSDHIAFTFLTFVRKPWVTLHRYVYVSNGVVEKVREIYNG